MLDGEPCGVCPVASMVHRVVAILSSAASMFSAELSFEAMFPYIV